MATTVTESADWARRRHALLQAKERGDTAYLLAALRDPDHRSLAAKILGELGTVDAADPLLILLRAEDPHVRAEAVATLGKLGVEETRQSVRELAMGERNAMVRAWAIDALAKFPGDDDAELIVNALGDDDPRVRAAAANSIRSVTGLAAIRALEEATPSLKKSVREWFLYRGLYRDALRDLRRRTHAADQQSVGRE